MEQLPDAACVSILCQAIGVDSDTVRSGMLVDRYEGKVDFSYSPQDHYLNVGLNNYKDCVAGIDLFLQPGYTRLRCLEHFRDTLYVLSVIKCHLVKIENLCLLSKLRVVMLSDNRITSIEGLEDLPNLQRLYLEDNRITSFENLNSPKLEVLCLQGNKITRLPACNGLPMLKELRLDRNSIATLPSRALATLQSLERLTIANNPIKGLHELIKLKRVRTLRHLVLSDAVQGEAASSLTINANLAIAMVLSQLDTLDCMQLKTVRLKSMSAYLSKASYYRSKVASLIHDTFHFAQFPNCSRLEEDFRLLNIYASSEPQDRRFTETLNGIKWEYERLKGHFIRERRLFGILSKAAMEESMGSGGSISIKPVPFVSPNNTPASSQAGTAQQPQHTQSPTSKNSPTRVFADFGPEFDDVLTFVHSSSSNKMVGAVFSTLGNCNDQGPGRHSSSRGSLLSATLVSLRNIRNELLNAGFEQEMQKFVPTLKNGFPLGYNPSMKRLYLITSRRFHGATGCGDSSGVSGIATQSLERRNRRSGSNITMPSTSVVGEGNGGLMSPNIVDELRLMELATIGVERASEYPFHRVPLTNSLEVALYDQLEPFRHNREEMLQHTFFVIIVDAVLLDNPTYAQGKGVTSPGKDTQDKLLTEELPKELAPWRLPPIPSVDSKPYVTLTSDIEPDALVYLVPDSMLVKPVSVAEVIYEAGSGLTHNVIRSLAKQLPVIPVPKPSITQRQTSTAVVPEAVPVCGPRGKWSDFGQCSNALLLPEVQNIFFSSVANRLANLVDTYHIDIKAVMEYEKRMLEGDVTHLNASLNTTNRNSAEEVSPSERLLQEEWRCVAQVINTQVQGFEECLSLVGGHKDIANTMDDGEEFGKVTIGDQGNKSVATLKEKCACVHELNLSGIGLVAVPPLHTLFPNLRRLYLNNNNITVDTLKKMGLYNLQKLKELHLSNNRLTMFPRDAVYQSAKEKGGVRGETQKMVKLKHLDISYNKITSITRLRGLMSIPSLESLSLMGNVMPQNLSFFYVVLALKTVCPKLSCLDGAPLRCPHQVSDVNVSTSNSSVNINFPTDSNCDALGNVKDIVGTSMFDIEIATQEDDSQFLGRGISVLPVCSCAIDTAGERSENVSLQCDLYESKRQGLKFKKGENKSILSTNRRDDGKDRVPIAENKSKMGDGGEEKSPQGNTVQQEGEYGVSLAGAGIALFDFTNLEKKLVTLDLSMNPAISPSVTHVVNIRSLTMRECTLTSIDFIQHFKVLEHIDVSENMLENLSGLEHCKGLKEVLASYNKLRDISSLFSLDTLEGVSLCNNELTMDAVVPLLSHKALSHLDLLNNPCLAEATTTQGGKRISRIKATVLYSSPHIKLLNRSVLSQKEVDKAQGTYGQGITREFISSLLMPQKGTSVNDIINVSDIKCLDISGCELTRLNDFNVSCLPQVQVANLSGCGICLDSLKTLPGQLPDTLEQLLLSNNNITSQSLLINQMPTLVAKSLRVLDISNNPIGIFQKEVLSGLQMLEVLKIRKINVSMFPENSFVFVNYLKHLDMSDNKIQVLPKGIFRQTRYLEFIDLSHNVIRTLNFFDIELANVTTVDLSNNKIQSLTELGSALLNLPNLQYLYIKGNPAAKAQGCIELCLFFCHGLVKIDGVEVTQTQRDMSFAMFEKYNTLG